MAPALHQGCDDGLERRMECLAEQRRQARQIWIPVPIPDVRELRATQHPLVRAPLDLAERGETEDVRGLRPVAVTTDDPALESVVGKCHPRSNFTCLAASGRLRAMTISSSRITGDR